ncbi:MAG: 4'-phosphopantetheinyl transferase family protein [Jatrophihabitans sp.]
MTGQDRVQVWLIRTEQPAAVVLALAETLDESERRRADLITTANRRAEFVVAHGAVRTILGEQLGQPAEALRWSFGRHGKPELFEPDTELRCNLSHSGGLAALAVAVGRPVGVDVQRRRTAVDLDRMARRYYPASEVALVAVAGNPVERAVIFTRLWSRKEACVKAAGGRLIPALGWPASALPDGTVLVTDPAGQAYRAADLPMPTGYHGAAAVTGAAPLRLTSRWWSPAAEPLSPTAPDPMAVQLC